MFKRTIATIIFILALIVGNAYCSDYSQQQVWVTGEVIIASKLNQDVQGIINTVNDLDNENISDTAGITYSKLNLSNGIKNADVYSAAAIEGTKIDPDFGSQNIVTTGNISVDVISGDDITSSNDVTVGNDLTVTNHLYAIEQFGSRVSKNDNTNYQADADGYFFGWGEFGPTDQGYVYIEAGDSTPDVVIVEVGVVTGGDTGTTNHSFCVLVGKDEYYKANFSSGDDRDLWWQPFD